MALVPVSLGLPTPVFMSFGLVQARYSRVAALRRAPGEETARHAPHTGPQTSRRGPIRVMGPPDPHKTPPWRPLLKDPQPWGRPKAQETVLPRFFPRTWEAAALPSFYPRVAKHLTVDGARKPDPASRPSHVRPAPRMRAPPPGRSRPTPGHLASAAAEGVRFGGPRFLSSLLAPAPPLFFPCPCSSRRLTWPAAFQSGRARS